MSERHWSVLMFNFIFKLHNFHCFHPFYTFPVSTKPICEDDHDTIGYLYIYKPMARRLSYNHWPIVQGHQNNKTRDTHYKRHNIYNFEQHLKLKIELLYPLWKPEVKSGEIANTKVKHSKKAKLNIMHMTVNFLGLFFFGPAKYFSDWQDFHVCQSEWLTTSQQVSGSLTQSQISQLVLSNWSWY